MAYLNHNVSSADRCNSFAGTCISAQTQNACQASVNCLGQLMVSIRVRIKVKVRVRIIEGYRVWARATCVV